MDKKALDGVLEKDELVLWTGKPVSFKILDKYYKPELIKSYIIAAVVVGAILAWALTAISKGRDLNMIGLSIFLLAPFILIPVKAFQYMDLRKKYNYVLTDRNIIVYVSESEYLKYPLSNIEKFESVPQYKNTWSIRIGKAYGIPDKKNRDYAVKLKAPAGEKIDSCLLYNLSESDAKTVVKLIEKYRIVA